SCPDQPQQTHNPKVFSISGIAGLIKRQSEHQLAEKKSIFLPGFFTSSKIAAFEPNSFMANILSLTNYK
ncbi:hypothetical protein PZ01_14445, partial [Lacticaseibacillus rhamnosus]